MLMALPHSVKLYLFHLLSRFLFFQLGAAMLVLRMVLELMVPDAHTDKGEPAYFVQSLA